jgi:CRISP-associated protein Cas1
MLLNLNTRLPFVYLEMGRLRMQSSSLAFINSSQTVVLPAGKILTIFLGPGTTITEGAVKYCMKVKCLIVWVGEDITRCYSMLPVSNQDSHNLLRQVELYTKKFNSLIKKYYEIRFGKPLITIVPITPDKFRGIEGAYMKKIYLECSRKFGIPYSGRMREDEWDKNTIYNRAISICNSLLYGMCCSIIVSLGYSPALGIVHTGDMLSFVYDIADIYKPIFSIPYGFEISKIISNNKCPPANIDGEVRRGALTRLNELNLTDRIISDIESILYGGVSVKKSYRGNQEVTANL